MKRRRSWVDGYRARCRWLVGCALEGSARPLPMHRYAVLWLACRMIEVDVALSKLAR